METSVTETKLKSANQPVLKEKCAIWLLNPSKVCNTWQKYGKIYLLDCWSYEISHCCFYSFDSSVTEACWYGSFLSLGGAFTMVKYNYFKTAMSDVKTEKVSHFSNVSWQVKPRPVKTAIEHNGRSDIIQLVSLICQLLSWYQSKPFEHVTVAWMDCHCEKYFEVFGCYLSFAFEKS